ncbi:MAG: hypothetical protein A3J07_03870 [Candidatus Doudnabacteria bacterium RIFCSPLOWO2_02_FULL_49_13]|uniref:Uncharacterized protein n=1 Tax=Candidatus Doudnabacteria bacterium RIFCSPHIGHO2_12_FULL_48_16 TaxID=1817838 RepID=A0A1F5PJS8_9BACT|nr:MAG: hypothetical protein A3B77_02680 [Candidatus Doudnabacteria bacterium RIFCSPHIGHO2_02_FULL_49_24]OGE89611.1 MAG: hypothetical protein A2760_03885 [Candidatus Doudnabacteria bacterium RIFCSPHIGHO2_01_FULL_50_67]OGE90054.1 MAG: hypothetical protein A3E29_03015 [Candidatus Doudnabacteria bacterium RIFCSPHIGHO2_12_FULL_48_16]OGE96627.1 MAG: hypothetical protein A2990_00325 [Candidatus Doudnabacteria bacterium RIFCSPLOWO2_01_FULL_49_40]OGF03197.1 MAG: hypothetical protein A3J07_03870 [Candid
MTQRDASPPPPTVGRAKYTGPAKYAPPGYVRTGPARQPGEPETYEYQDPDARNPDDGGD